MPPTLPSSYQGPLSPSSPTRAEIEVEIAKAKQNNTYSKTCDRETK